MAKTRTTLTTCDFSGCEDHYAGDTAPEGWINVAIRGTTDDKPERLVFCSYEDLANYASETSGILAGEGPDNGD